MRILQHHVLVDLLRVFSLAITVLTMLLVVMGVAGEAARNGLGAQQIVMILPYIIPSLLPYTIPATLLLTVCIVYGRMSGDHEITAIKAAGINPLSVLLPSFALGTGLSLATFFLTDQFIPWGRANIERIVTMAMEDIFLDVLRANNSYNDAAHGISINVTRVDDRTLIKPIFRYSLPDGGVAMITARRATVEFRLQDQQVILNLRDGHIETQGGANVAFDQETQALPMPTPTDTLKAPRNMTIESIRRELALIARERRESVHSQIIKAVMALSDGTFDGVSAAAQAPSDQKEAQRIERHQKLRTELHGRVALSCSCFFFVLIGSPFAIAQGRRQFLTSFALCFAPILVGYYPLVLLTMNLCRDGLIDPTWGMWTGNLALLVTGALVLRKVLRN